MNRKFIFFLICAVIIFVLTACGEERINSAEENEEDDEIVNVSDNLGVGDRGTLDLDGLKTKLKESVLVELKDINNDTIGVINNTNNIAFFVNRISEYEIVESYIEENNQNVIGPINVFYGDGTAMYGLMKDEYIYLEGYYFILDQRERSFLENYFRNNIKEINTSE